MIPSMRGSMKGVKVCEASVGTWTTAQYSATFRLTRRRMTAFRRALTASCLRTFSSESSWSRRVSSSTSFSPEGVLSEAGFFSSTNRFVGFGRIGQAVARRAAGFGMRVLYYDTQRIFPEVEKQFGAEYRDIHDLLRESDFVTLHAVLDQTTHHLIDDKAFALMKRSAYLVNAARGPIVDETALVKALRRGRIRGAALDVYEFEPRMAAGLSGCRNAVIVPHIASASLETRTRMGMMAAEGLVDVLIRRKAPAHPANPEACAKLFAAA